MEKVHEYRMFIIKYPETLRKELFEFSNKKILITHWVNNWETEKYPESEKMGWVEEFGYYVPEEELKKL